MTISTFLAVDVLLNRDLALTMISILEYSCIMEQILCSRLKSSVMLELFLVVATM